MKNQNIKTLLHESIENIDDVDFLMAIKDIIDRKYSPSTAPKLSGNQVERIEKSKEQIRSGQYLSNEQAESLVAKWLKE